MDLWQLAGAALLLTATRYEGAFLVLGVMTVAVCQRRLRDALAVGAAGALPIVAFGVYAVAHGGHWLPNPLLVKSDLLHVHSLGGFVAHLVQVKLHEAHVMTALRLLLMVALLGSAIDMLTLRRLNRTDHLFVLLVTATALLHLLAARVGWLGRYEAYLLVLAAVAAVLCWRNIGEYWERAVQPGMVLPQLIVVALFLLASVPLVMRLGETLACVPTASKNIHDQQLQMARFVERCYPGQPIVANDIGALLWYARAQPLDLAGLATYEIASARRAESYTPALVNALARARQARIAVVYQTVLPQGQAPPGWIHVGRWTIVENKICGEATVEWYALDTDAAAPLAANLRAFAPHLPADVRYDDLRSAPAAR